ncbi:MAG: hypothetical protein E7612_11445 [Ruminococcaceae bacterium]|nr:hypothetical protein [Oscillospiraceae bacterium]
MAKYVGKIFRIDNRTLKLKGASTHYVHVKWYNPFTRLFRCRVVTSLENRIFLGENKRTLGSTPYHKNEDQSYSLFEKQNSKLRSGKIEPIPISKAKGFDSWHGYEGTRYLHARHLKGKERKNLIIKK